MCAERIPQDRLKVKVTVQHAITLIETVMPWLRFFERSGPDLTSELRYPGYPYLLKRFRDSKCTFI